MTLIKGAGLGDHGGGYCLLQRAVAEGKVVPQHPAGAPAPSALLSAFPQILPEGREMKAGLTLPCLPCLSCLPTSFPTHSSPSFISPGVPVRTQHRSSLGWRRPWRFPLC